MVNVLLTGGSGTVGRKVLELLVGISGFNVTAFDQNTFRTRRFYRRFRGKLEVVYGDIAQPDDIGEVCNRKDFVIHLAAIIPPVADAKPEAARRVNVEGTRNLILGLEKNAPDAFFLHASSVSVYGDRLQNPDILTTDPLSPSEDDAYGQTKCEAESLVKASPLSWSIFRLSAIMGAGNHKISGLMFHMPLNTPVEITTPEDTAVALVNAIRMKESIKGKIFNLGGGLLCRIIYRDLLTRSFAIYGLGDFRFPEKSFAEKNFHCGYYADGHELEELLHFRHDTMDTYFSKVRDSVSPFQKMMTAVVRKTARRILLSRSEPYRAWVSRDEAKIRHWFITN